MVEGENLVVVSLETSDNRSGDKEEMKVRGRLLPWARIEIFVLRSSLTRIRLLPPRKNGIRSCLVLSSEAPFSIVVL